MYPGAAMFNHSCSPNCRADDVSVGVITVRTIVEVQPGDEMTIAYGARFSTEIYTRGMPLDPTHVRLKRTCVSPMAFLSGVHFSDQLAL
jgi:SET domain-containing protein